MAYRRSVGNDWDDKRCVGWLRYTHSCGAMLDIPDCDMSVLREMPTLYKLNASSGRSCPFQALTKRNLEKARDAVSAAYGSSLGLPDPSEDVPIIKNGVVEEKSP